MKKNRAAMKQPGESGVSKGTMNDMVLPSAPHGGFVQPDDVPGDPSDDESPAEFSSDPTPRLEGLVRGNAGWLRGWFRGRVRDPEIVDDLCQETFLRALRGFSRLRDPARFPAWIYRTAENLLRDHLRRKRRRGDRVVFTDSLDTPDRDPTPEEKMLRKEMASELLASVEELPARYREPFLLRHTRDLTYAEISNLLGVTESAVRVRVFRARKILREKCDAE